MRHVLFGFLFALIIMYCKSEDLFRCIGTCLFLALVYIASEIADGNKLRAEEFKWKKIQAEKAEQKQNNAASSASAAN